MKFMLLASELITDWGTFVEKAGTGLTGGKGGWLDTLITTLSMVMWIILALVGAAGGVYAVFVGIKMARADSAEQREEGKKRFINIIVSVVVVIVLIIFFQIFLPMILGMAMNLDKNDLDGGTDAVNTIANMTTAAKVMLRLPL